jgi:molecular chaperone HtpG
MNISVTTSETGTDHFLIFSDDGIGLTEDEVHLFLATIGQTSKRGEFASLAQFDGHPGKFDE